MTNRVVTFGPEARAGIKNGVDLIANAIKVTLGPKGRNAIYGYHYGFPIATKDGVTVAKQVDSKDGLEQIGLQLVRQAAQKTADDAGDGTTTASILAQAIYTEGLKSLSTGANPILIKRGIDKAVDEVIRYIDNVRIEVPKDSMMLFDVATISANNDKSIGSLIIEAISKVGDHGVITIEDNQMSDKCYVETVEGMQLNEGLLSPFFCTDMTKMTADYSNPKILLVDGEIDNIRPLQKIIEATINQNRPIVIICHSISGHALQTLVLARTKNMLPIMVCKAPQFGQFRTEQMLDISCLIGGKMVGAATGVAYEDISEDDLGEADSISATKATTTIVAGKATADRVKERIAQIEGEMAKVDNDYDKQKLQERLAKLTSGVAVIKVGAQTEVDRKEIKMRVEDSLHATRAAIEEGIVPGGGIVYVQASRTLAPKGTEAEIIGIGIIKRALLEPIKTIAFNAGVEHGEIIANNSLTNNRYGYNFLTDEYGDMVEMGVIDPVKVIKQALLNAASVAGTLLTTEVTIHEVKEEDIYPKTPKSNI